MSCKKYKKPKFITFLKSRYKFPLEGCFCDDCKEYHSESKLTKNISIISLFLGIYLIIVSVSGYFTASNMILGKIVGVCSIFTWVILSEFFHWLYIRVN